MAERLALPTSDHGVAGSNPAGGEILPEPKRRFIAQSLSCSPFHRLEMTEKLLKGRKTLTHPSIHFRLYNTIISRKKNFFVCCLAHRGSTVGFLLLQCSSGVVRHPRDLQVSVATHFCRVLIFASS